MINICVIDTDKNGSRHIVGLIRDFFEEYASPVEIDVIDNLRQLRPELWKDCSYDLVLLDISARETREASLRYSSKARSFCQKTKVIFMARDPMACLDIFDYAPDYFIWKMELDRRLRIALKHLFDLEKIKSGNSIVFETKSVKYIVPTESILYCEHYQHDTRVVCEDKEILCHKKLSELMEQLDGDMFLRCHCSFIVNIRHVREFNRTSLLLDTGKTIPCSRANIQLVKDTLMKRDWRA